MKKTLFGIALLIVALLVSVTLILTTSFGLRFVASMVLPVAPGKISYESLDGSLIGPLQLSGLRWENGDRKLTVANTSLDWQPTALISRHLHITELTADGVHWQAPEAEAATTPAAQTGFSLPALPITISADQLQLSNIKIDQGASAFAVQSIQLAGQLNNKHYTIQSLVLHSELADVSGSAAVGVKPPHAIDATLNWTVRLADLPEAVSGTTRASGDSDSLALMLTASGPVALELSGTASDLLGTPGINGELDIKGLDPAIAGLDAETGTISAVLNFSAAAQSLAVAGRIQAAKWPDAAIIDARVRLDGGIVEIQQLKAQLENLPTIVEANGTVNIDLSNIELELAWTDLVWPPNDTPTVSSPGGNAQLSGSLARYNLQLQGQLDDGVIPKTAITLTGDGNATSFNIASINAVFEQGQASGNGVLDWEKLPEARLELKTQDLDLKQWQDQLEGRLGFDSTIVASLPADGARVSVDVHKARGNLRGQMLAAKGSFDYAPGLIQLNKVDLRAGAAKVEANGRIGSNIDLNWNLSIPNIALLLPNAAGLIRSQGKASGRRNSPGLVGDLLIEDVRIGTFSARQISGDYDIGIQSDANASIELRGTGIQFGSVELLTFASDTNGTVAQHTTAIEIDGPLGKLQTVLNGGIDADSWQGQITQLAAERWDVGIWQLVEPAALAIRRDHVTVQTLCLSQVEARLCAGGEFATNEPWRGEFQLTALPLQILAPFLPPDLDYDGLIAGQGNIESTGTDWSGSARLELSDGQVLTRESGDDNILIAYRNGLLDASFNPASINTKISLDLRDAGEFDADITVPLQANQSLAGTVKAKIENLSIVTALVPQIGRIDGRLEANLVLAGTASQPDLSGQIALRTTELILPDLGIVLKDAVVNVVTQGNDLRFDGSAGSGEGNVALSGELRWRDGLPRGQLKIDGENFRAIDLPEINLDASPALVLTVDGRDIEISGEIAMPSANITPIDIGTGSTVSTDQVIVGKAAEAVEETPWQIGGSVQVTAGDAVHIKGFGLEGQLTGSVLVIETPNQPTTGRGSLEIIDGLYRAYGQELKIETGRLTFTGGQIDDPGLNLLATRTAGDVVAGAQVRGALRAPVLTLYSVPSMSDTQAMSYLITGRGLEELSELDQTTVTDTATRLALQGGSVLATSLGRGLGLDSVEFNDSGETASTALVVGKQLSPRLFVSYGIGLFEAINTLRLRYRINSRLTLETQSGTRTSADLLYSIER